MTERVRFVGEIVAAVVAGSRYDAEDAVELVQADLDPLPAVMTFEDAMSESATLVHDSVPDKEQQECINKAKALFRAAEEARRFASAARKGQ